MAGKYGGRCHHHSGVSPMPNPTLNVLLEEYLPRCLNLGAILHQTSFLASSLLITQIGDLKIDTKTTDYDE